MMTARKKAEVRAARIAGVVEATVRLTDVWSRYAGSAEVAELRNRWADVLLSDAQSGEMLNLILDNLFALDPDFKKAWDAMTVSQRDSRSNIILNLIAMDLERIVTLADILREREQTEN